MSNPNAQWTEIDAVTGESRQVELPAELAELVERAVTEGPGGGYTSREPLRDRGEGDDLR